MSEDKKIRVPFSADAERYLEDVERRRTAVFATVSRLPIAVLIWGPNPDGTSPAAQARILLRDELIRNGHVAQFSEDLIDATLNRSIQLQELAHAEAADIVFSIPDSIGSAAEIHGFANLPPVGNKIVTFLDSRFLDGYASRSLVELQTQLTCRVELYDATLLPGSIIAPALAAVRRLQEVHYILGRRV